MKQLQNALSGKLHFLHIRDDQTKHYMDFSGIVLAVSTQSTVGKCCWGIVPEYQANSDGKQCFIAIWNCTKGRGRDIDFYQIVKMAYIA